MSELGTGDAVGALRKLGWEQVIGRRDDGRYTIAAYDHVDVKRTPRLDVSQFSASCASLDHTISFLKWATSELDLFLLTNRQFLADRERVWDAVCISFQHNEAEPCGPWFCVAAHRQDWSPAVQTFADLKTVRSFLSRPYCNTCGEPEVPAVGEPKESPQERARIAQQLLW